jgi:hypothetical protein
MSRAQAGEASGGYRLPRMVALRLDLEELHQFLQL